MYPSTRFIETFRLDYGICLNFEAHYARMARTLRAHSYNLSVLEGLEEQAAHFETSLPVVKGRIVYGNDFLQVNFSEYTPRVVQSLRLVRADNIDYSYKYEDRSAINRLHALRGAADDILIAQDGLLTDTSFSNIALWNGKEWVTPTSFLLNGTRRQTLLQNGVLREQKVRIADLAQYQEIQLLNAMLDFPNPRGIHVLIR